MDEKIEKVCNDSADYFFVDFGISLEDSPQISDEYLYLEYDGLFGTTKLRLPHPKDKSHFLNMTTLDRINWINKEILRILIGPKE